MRRGIALTGERRCLPWRRCLGLLTVFLGLVGTTGRLNAAEPLHRRVDRLIEAKLEQEPAPAATDAEFLRRVSLDLGGMIPTSTEAREFLDDPSPYKRAKLIDRLLASPAYVWRMADVFDVMFMERRNDAHVPSAEWRAFLRRSIAANVPYDQLVAAILSADGADPKSRPAAKFLLDREAEPNQVTRDVGRVFLGRDLQCAQCHDHPLIDDYKQAHYYGLFAFVSRTAVVNDAKKGAVLSEKGEGEVSFSSVFKKGITHKTGPRVLDQPPVAEPEVPKGAEYLLAPNKDNTVQSIPRVSRRVQLAPRLATAEVPQFSRNIVNRLWALMFGRGLVYPLDMDHSENPPSHPELLDLLTKEFAAQQFDIKAFLRELALTRAYQRSSEVPPVEPVSPSDKGTPSTPAPLAVAALKALTPEQLAWSTMQGLGLVESTRQSAEETLGGRDARLRAIFDTDARRRQLRTEMVEALVHERLDGGVAPFIQQFAASAGQPQDATEPTVHQALFLSNGYPVQGWLAPSGTNLTARLGSLTDPNAVADELYLSLFSRRPTSEERAEVARYLSERGKDRVPALQELAWALLASTEFRFNH
ncbi:MAG: DUF1549 domain-containing protein [Isosphaeraceae bacterium]